MPMFTCVACLSTTILKLVYNLLYMYTIILLFYASVLLAECTSNIFYYIVNNDVKASIIIQRKQSCTRDALINSYR